MVRAMPKGASSRSLAGGAALLCLVSLAAAVAFVAGARRAVGVPNDGCTSDRDRERARALANLPFITVHPDAAEAVDDSEAGCDSVSGEIGVGREYYWARFDPG